MGQVVDAKPCTVDSMRAGFARFGLSFVMLCVQWQVLVLLAGVFRTPIALDFVIKHGQTERESGLVTTTTVLRKRTLRAKGRIN